MQRETHKSRINGVSAYLTDKYACMPSTGAIVEKIHSEHVIENIYRMSDFTNTRSGVQIHADQILEMKDYRSYKAGILLSIRQERNINRKTLKTNQANYLSNPVEYSLSNIESGLTRIVENAIGLLEELIEVSFSVDNNTFHPAENKQAIVSTYNAFLRYVCSYTSDITRPMN